MTARVGSTGGMNGSSTSGSPPRQRVAVRWTAVGPPVVREGEVERLAEPRLLEAVSDRGLLTSADPSASLPHTAQ
jgi:hypothetical protein